MPKFFVKAKKIVYHRGTIWAESEEDLKRMEPEEMGLSEYDSSALEIEEIIEVTT